MAEQNYAQLFVGGPGQKVRLLNQAFDVETIIDKKKIDNEWKYLVKWEGYSSSENTWEPIKNLKNVWPLVDEFETQWSQKHRKKATPTTTQKKRMIDNMAFNSNVQLLQQPMVKQEAKSIPPLKNPWYNTSSDSSENNLKNETVQKQIESTTSNKQKNKFRQKILESSEQISEKVCSEKSYITKDNKDHYQKFTYSQSSCDEVTGSFEQGDDIDQILFVKLLNNRLMFYVQWKERKNGVRPTSSIVSNEILKQNCPQKLIDFYEIKTLFGEEFKKWKVLNQK